MSSVAHKDAQDPVSFRFTYEGNKYKIPADFILKQHPGGKDIILQVKDGDITSAFLEADHSPDAFQMLEEWKENKSPEEAKILADRQAKRLAEEDKWRWRSTAIAFTIGTVVAAVMLSTK